MKRVKMPTSDRDRDYLIESLKDPEEAVAYIEAILEVENPEPELLQSAIEDVIDAVTDAVERKASFNAIHLETTEKADFFVLGDDAFSQSKLHRR